MPSPAEPSEAELDALMARVSEGERDAFPPLFRALHPRARRVAARRLDPARADEVAQAAMMKLFLNATAFTPGRPALPWFYAVVANEVRAELRRRVATNAVPESVPDPGPRPEDAIAERELRRALQQSIDALDPTSAEAIAVLLGEAAPTAAPATHRKRLSRAYARLRALLGGSHGL